MNISSLKKNISIFLFLILFIGGPQSIWAQEINANVTIDRSQINSTSLGYLDKLPQQIEEYINQYEWTNANFNENERIKMSLQINLLSVEDYNFKAQIIVRSQRPIYNTTRNTVLFLFNDEEWDFEYTPNRTFLHDELQFDPLISLIDFYIYIILGYDFDSFEELGGTEYYQRAQNILSLAQSTSAIGWSRSSNQRNRAQLVSNLLQTNYELFRAALYQYHREGIDQFLDNPEQARNQIISALEKIQQAQRQTSSNLLFDMFFNAKYRELTSIFEDAEPQIRLEAYNMLSNIDQSHLSEYQKLQ
ncbi:type IX secretion system protein PorD [Fodinibius sp. AD559]|uniref:type IX secretion system protein PorD n=1 Tax=Fodinibius sp. AD559 TaxID=3424179 RepID=UPI004046F3B6